MSAAILALGPAMVRARTMAPLGSSEPVPARMSVSQARAIVDDAVKTFTGLVNEASTEQVEQDRLAAERAECLDPCRPSQTALLVHAVRVDVGVGKSCAIRWWMSDTLAQMRARGDKRTFVFAIPTHALADEQIEQFMALPAAKKAGLTAAIWRGRSAPNPDHPDYRNPAIARSNKTTMCGDLERVREARAYGLSAQTAACKRTLKKPDGSKVEMTCPLFESCFYQAQTHK